MLFKKIALVLGVSTTLFSTAAFADRDDYHGRGYGYRGYREVHEYHHGGYNNWVAPALIGGIVGYELSRPYYNQPQVIYTQPQVIYQQQPQVIYTQPPVVQQTTCQVGFLPYYSNNQFIGCIQQ